MEVISRDGTTAQIDPKRFCGWLKESVEKRGVRVLNPATATEVLRDAQGVLSGVRVVGSQDQQTQDRKLSRMLVLDVGSGTNALMQYLARASSSLQAHGRPASSLPCFPQRKHEFPSPRSPATHCSCAIRSSTLRN
jgi:hypothetical protein